MFIHGLNAAFLNLVLNCFDSKIIKQIFGPETVPDLSSSSKYATEIFYEKNFKSENTVNENRVDIVIKISKSDSGDRNKDVLEIFNEKEIVAIIIIEVKIEDSASVGKKEQLEKQYKAAKENELVKKKYKGEIFSIFISPNGINTKIAFEELNNEKKIWIKWLNAENNNEIEDNKEIEDKSESNAIELLNEITEDDNKGKLKSKPNTISAILQKIIILEQQSAIEPIYEYAKHTIKAFLNYIKDKFSSKPSSSTNKVIKYTDWETFLKSDDIDSHFKSFIDLNTETSNKLIKRIEDFNGYFKTKSSFTTKRISVKPNTSSRDNYIILVFENNEFSVGIYISKECNQLDFLNPLFGKVEKYTSIKYDLYSSNVKFTLDDLIENKMFEMFKKVAEINNQKSV